VIGEFLGEQEAVVQQRLPRLQLFTSSFVATVMNLPTFHTYHQHDYRFKKWLRPAVVRMLLPVGGWC
jgi:hypothetical protein